MPSIYELTAPLFAMKHMRIETAASHRAIDYDSEYKFFADFPQRRSMIRESSIGEFDLDMPIGEFLQVPKLWCLVTQIQIGIHSIVPVYRGRKFWQHIKDDAGLGMVLCEMERREGIDAHEWDKFEKRVNDKNKKFLSSSNGMIH